MKKRLPLLAGLLAVLIAAGGATYVLRDGDDDPATAPVAATAAAPGGTASASPSNDASETASGAEKDVALGVFRSTSPEDVQQFGEWLGRDVEYVIDFSRRQTWDEIAAPYDQLRAWEGSDYRIVYGLAMLPEDKDLDVSLAAGADGDYNRYYRALAENLVKYGQENAILRLGWEFNLGSWRWHPGDRKDFVGYWRQVVTTMRSVPGAQDLEFDWNVGNGGTTYDSTRFYPGDKYVDYVGVDVYDLAWADGTYPYPAECSADCRQTRQKKAWKTIVGAKFGLDFWSAFAASREKPLSLPEWGLWDRTRTDGHGGADNPYFVEQMYAFIDDPANNVAYQAYFEWDVEASGNHRLSDLKESGQTYQRLFG